MLFIYFHSKVRSINCMHNVNVYIYIAHIILSLGEDPWHLGSLFCTDMLFPPEVGVHYKFIMMWYLPNQGTMHCLT